MVGSGLYIMNCVIGGHRTKRDRLKKEAESHRSFC